MLNRVLKRIGVRSRSAPHSHHFQHAPRHNSQPVWLLGAARTGTTTLFYQISAASSRNAVFEPMGPRGAGLGLSDYARESWIGSPAPEDAKRINQWLVKPSRPHSEAPGVSEAANWLRSFYSEVGTNLVVKEIRCVPRCQDLLRAHAIAGEKPILVGVVGHPLGAVYSFYRLRALGVRESLDGSRTDGLWPLRAMRYQSMGFHRELTSIRPKTRIDEVALAVLLDQAELHRLFSAGDLHSLVGLGRTAIIGSGSQLPADCRLPEGVPASSAWQADRFFRRVLRKNLSPEVRDVIADRFSGTRTDGRTCPLIRRSMTYGMHCLGGGVAASIAVAWAPPA